MGEGLAEFFHHLFARGAVGEGEGVRRGEDEHDEGKEKPGNHAFHSDCRVMPASKSLRVALAEEARANANLRAAGADRRGKITAHAHRKFR